MHRNPSIFVSFALLLAGSATLRAQDDPLRDRLLAHYSFEGTDLARDVSGNNWNGRVEGVESAPGVIGRGARFSGQSRIAIDAFAGLPWGSAFAVSIWFKRTGGWGDFAGLINNGRWPACSWELRLGRDLSGGALIGGVATYNDPSVIDFKNLDAPPEQWHHVALSYDGSVARLFLDGVEQDGRKSDSGKIVKSEEGVLMGVGAKGRQEYFQGTLDEVRLYRRPLTDEDAQLLWEQGAGAVQRQHFAQQQPPPMAAPGTAGATVQPEPIPPMTAPGAAAEEEPPAIDGPALEPEPALESAFAPEQAPEVEPPEPEPEPSVEVATPSPTPEAQVHEPADPPAASSEACEAYHRWIELWRAGNKQQVVDELNALGR